MTHEEAVSLIRARLQIVHAAAFKSVVASSPFSFLLIPPLGIITNKVIDHLSEKIIEKEELGAFIIRINMNTDAQGVEFMKYASQNDIAQRNGTPEEKKRAEDLLKKAMDALIPFRN